MNKGLTSSSGGVEETVRAELELRRRRRENESLLAPAHWRDWTKTMFPRHFKSDFAPHHVEYWDWLESIVPGVAPRVFIGIWGRGDAKSTSAEAGCVRIGSKGVRKYGLYISSTQDKADGHVMTIGSMLESKPYSNYYAKMSKRAVNKYGAAKGWKHNRLITASGFAIDAFGLDSGLRGAKLEENRPDFMVIDDVDEKFDSPATVMKKIQVITDSILPSGSDDCAIIFIQNLIHPDSIASRLVDGRADFLRRRVLSGPHPATRNLTYEYDEHEGRYIVTGGQPTWASRTLEDVQAKIDNWGLSAYLREAQHEVEKREGPWKDVVFRHVTIDELPEFVTKVCWVDPAISSNENSNSQGISIGGKTVAGHLVGLYWWEGVQSPQKTLEQAIEKAYEWGCEHVGVETDQGGDTWESVYNEAKAKVLERLKARWKVDWLEEHEWATEAPEPHDELFHLPKFTHDKASKVRKRAGLSVGSKMERNGQMMADYELGKVRHMVGTHSFIEKALYRVPENPWDLADSWWWTWFDTIGQKKERFGAR